MRLADWLREGVIMAEMGGPGNDVGPIFFPTQSRRALDHALSTLNTYSRHLQQLPVFKPVSVAFGNGLPHQQKSKSYKQKGQVQLFFASGIPAALRHDVGHILQSCTGAGKHLRGAVDKAIANSTEHIKTKFMAMQHGFTSFLVAAELLQRFQSMFIKDRLTLLISRALTPAVSQASRLPLASLSSTFAHGHHSARSDSIPESRHLFDLALSIDQVSKAINGVPVYTVSNSSNEFVLVSDLDSNKSLGVFCFRQEDAEALLAQVKDREPSLGRGARVVEVMLDKVYRLNAEGIAFRFLPDPHQVKNAIEERSRRGDTSKGFSGVPVFQSDNLILKIKNRRCCPVFFCKEDLENALRRAFMQQKRSNPSLRANTDVQVGSFEDVLKRMEGSGDDSGWADIVFIPPGMDAKNHLDKAVAMSGDNGAVIAKVEGNDGASHPPTVIC